MKTSRYRLLRLVILVMGAVFTAISAVNIFSAARLGIPFFEWVLLFRGIILMTIGIIITLKLRHANEHIFFALFLVNFAFNSWLPIIMPVWEIFVLSWAVTAASFIYAMIAYPGASMGELYQQYFQTTKHPRFYKKIVLYFTDPKHFWFVFFPLLTLLRTFAYFSSNSFIGLLNIFGIVSGLIYFRISYKLAGRSDKNRLAWVLWGIVVSLVLALIDVLINVFYPVTPPLIGETITVLYALTICISIMMAVFFAGFLDTGLVVRGTIVYSIIFLSVVFLFSFVEYFLEHGLETMFHIESDLMNAFLAGLLSLVINPLHKKLEKILPKF